MSCAEMDRRTSDTVAGDATTASHVSARLEKGRVDRLAGASRQENLTGGEIPVRET
jgi:hypothetical protein